ncbi:nuclease-related domain-containing protein [Heyndrickxia sporothermodurans]|uniref:nuclease-related domain-containing protein n=1 Tax=Heyndrickxia sporothermodurans TaxID=46224 RepID=UPI002E1FC2CB|nr:nuclease-related domain-containing protein [Heyndrickxia sporothermodurans]MED3699395.1 nuclease-related domain-containing protein [Heyndrickxia sporothermodurans]
MNFKPRCIPAELQVTQYLNWRMSLSPKEHSYYLNLEKGFIGEQRVDEWLKNLSEDWLILDDLLLECNGTVFQIDKVLISNQKIYIFEVKNYEGDFYIEADNWYTLSGTEIKNPLLQLQRSESLFRKLLQELGYHYQIESYIIFINPDFQLYQAPRDLPIIFPTQLNRFLNKLVTISPKIKDKHIKLAKHLVSLHIHTSPYKRTINYNFDNLKKGIICTQCHSFIAEFHKNVLICDSCGYKEKVTSAVLRSIEEYLFLFPEKKLTANAMYEWCEIIPKKTIYKVLSKNFKIIGHGKYSYYLR